MKKEMRQMSWWSKMSLWRRKRREEKQILMYVITLGKSLALEDDLAKAVQFGWWQVPLKGSPSQFVEQGILRISDHRGSWIRIISKWCWVLSIVLRMREFLQTFCEKNLRLCTIISWDWCLLWNEAILTCSHGSQYTF